MSRLYEPCGYIVGTLPAIRFCGKPVQVKRRHDFARCDDHGARLPYWPTPEPINIVVEVYERHIAPAVAACLSERAR